MHMLKLAGSGILFASVLGVVGLTGCELLGPEIEDAIEGAHEAEGPSRGEKGENGESGKPAKPGQCPEYSTDECCALADLYQAYSDKAKEVPKEEDREVLDGRMACMKPFLVKSCGFTSLPAPRCEKPESPNACPDFSRANCCVMAGLYQEYSDVVSSGNADKETNKGLRERMACMKPHLVNVCGFEKLPAKTCEGNKVEDAPKPPTPPVR